MMARPTPRCSAARALSCVAFLAAAFTVAHADFQVEMGAVRIVYPSNAKGRMDMALANFGSVKYGATLIGSLIYPSPGNLYGANYDCGKVPCNYGCSFFNESRPALKIERKPGWHNIMLLDRGPHDPDRDRPCYFLDKAYHAQLAGADALLVVNDQPGDLSTAVAPKDEDSERELAQLTISAGLISQEDGKQLKELLKNGPLTLALNWTDALPKASQVSWEFWTNSNDECGPMCDKQQRFIRDFKDIAKNLEVSSNVQFTPHYLIWVCQYSSDAEECKTQCIRQGAYCCPDPDDNIHEGYSGRDVLLMNVRSLCFSRVARANGLAWLWWQYVDTLGEKCPMSEKKYTSACSDDVWAQVVKGTKMESASALDDWKKCFDLGDIDSSDPVKLLDDELVDQTGNNTDSTIAILPTIRVNKKQYRGSLDAGSVLRGICAGFPEDSEPGMCNEGWVSEDECEVGGEGFSACNSWLNTTKGMTQCINTFGGWKCDCGIGFIKTTDNSTGQQSCEEINECLMTSQPWMLDDCKCDRCVCTNTVGSFNCSGPLPNHCTPSHNYGGCWKGTFDGRFYHACKDDFETYKELSEYGVRNESDKLWRCECPACFKPTKNGGCAPACDMAYCDGDNGCSNVRYDLRGRARGGVGGLGVFFIVVVTMGVTAAGMYAAYQWYVKRRMQEDMRNILEEYVPLANAPASNEPPRMFTMAASPVPPRITPLQ